ncbi:leucine-rich repeat and coiled-coil domain-containing protein 1 [Protopterus annectens]|uniref:leucine-rich repeat and coiled-coil domain-containing protein 1 n=1 Tax=Protopterus annectens TaxID=7888 RepID=UPI001CFB37D7|nr:leucine-rich repeat and coiled-coil domain-containing protein 1 [Protopterus annectens]
MTVQTKMVEGMQPAGDLCLIDKNISSLLEIPLDPNLQSLNLHCNQISKIEGLSHVWHLRHLDLSSNQITCIKGLGTLTFLRTLNLSCNLITKVEGLDGLVNLTRVNLSFNQISDLSGYREIVLHALPQLSVMDGVNRMGEPASLSADLLDIPGLEGYMEYLLSSDSSLNIEKSNGGFPLVTPRIDQVLAKYRERISPSTFAAMNSAVVGSLSTDVEPQKTNTNLYNELRLKKLEDQILQLLEKTSDSSEVAASQSSSKVNRDVDHTSESDCGSGKESRRKGGRRTKIPSYRRNTEASRHRIKKQFEDVKLHCGQEQHTAGKLKHSRRHSKNEDFTSTSLSGQTDLEVVGKTASPSVQKSQLQTGASSCHNATEESTYRALVEQLDLERERRWKAEQMAKKLSEQVKELHNQVHEEKNIQSTAINTTDRLKELLLKERATKSELQISIQELKEVNDRLTNEVKQTRKVEEQQRNALKSLKETLSSLEAERVQDQATKAKQIQEADLKAAAAQREVQLLRLSVRQNKEKVQQVQEVLNAREEAHRKEIASRVVFMGPEFQEALAKELAKEEKKHSQHIKEFEEKMNMLNKQYAELEEEFRMALTIEANRFKEVKEAFERVTSQLADHKQNLAKSHHMEKQSAALIQDLTSVVKEQKAKIAELTKSKQETVSGLKSRIRSLEAIAEEDRQKTIQIELLKREKSRFISQLTAQESVIDGLKAERKIWGEELAQQGSSLAQDRGRLEAKIEVFSTEIESLKKQNERDSDTIKIKARIIEDQTETIRKLKEGLQERDEQIRRLREENLQIQKSFQDQLDEENIELHDLKEKLSRVTDRKDQLKQQLEEKDKETEDVKKAYNAMNKKWQEKAELLNQLEAQVKNMKEHFDNKEAKLIEEKNKALEAQKATTEKLRLVDDAFRRQLESVQAAHQAELLQLATEKQKQLEEANNKVYQVEEEMRQLLRETVNSKKIMEEKISRLTSALSDIQQEL